MISLLVSRNFWLHKASVCWWCCEENMVGGDDHTLHYSLQQFGEGLSQLRARGVSLTRRQKTWALMLFKLRKSYILYKRQALFMLHALGSVHFYWELWNWQFGKYIYSPVSWAPPFPLSTCLSFLGGNATTKKPFKNKDLVQPYLCRIGHLFMFYCVLISKMFWIVIGTIIDVV